MELWSWKKVWFVSFWFGLIFAILIASYWYMVGTVPEILYIPNDVSRWIILPFAVSKWTDIAFVPVFVLLGIITTQRLYVLHTPIYFVIGIAYWTGLVFGMFWGFGLGLIFSFVLLTLMGTLYGIFHLLKPLFLYIIGSHLK
jgi:hypothetical protein